MLEKNSFCIAIEDNDLLSVSNLFIRLLLSTINTI